MGEKEGGSRRGEKEGERRRGVEGEKGREKLALNVTENG